VPVISRWYIKAGLLYLVAGLGLGAATAAWPGLRPGAWWPGFDPLVVHMLTVGWLTQLILGVAYWMFPPAASGPRRGPEGLMATAFVMLNVGLLLRLAAEALAAPGAVEPRGSTSLLGAFVVAGTLQWLASVAAAVALWGRVRSLRPG